MGLPATVRGQRHVNLSLEDPSAKPIRLTVVNRQELAGIANHRAF